MPKENEIQSPKLIIVEGNHERDFFNRCHTYEMLAD